MLATKSKFGGRNGQITLQKTCDSIPVSSDIGAAQLIEATVQIKNFQASWCQEKSLSEQILFHFTDHKSHHICWFCGRALRICKSFSF